MTFGPCRKEDEKSKVGHAAARTLEARCKAALKELMLPVARRLVGTTCPCLLRETSVVDSLDPVFLVHPHPSPWNEQNVSV